MTELVGKPQRITSPVDRTKQNIEAIDITPWKKVPRMAGDPNYFERTLPEWRSHNRNLEEAINNLAYAGEWGILEDELRREGYKHDELAKQIKSLEVGTRRNKNVRLRQDKYDVSQAAADESVSVGLLKAMGFSDAEIRNTNPLLGTDLSGTYKGHGYTIDAQQRLRRNGDLKLGITQFTPGALREFMDEGDLPLITLLNEYRRDTGRLTEGKLLQTANTDWNPKDLRSREFGENVDAYSKDLLISNGRPGSRIKDMHDRQLPNNTAMIDLNKARELILPKTANQMRNVGMHLNIQESQDGSMSLIVPRRIFENQLATEVDTNVVNEILRRKNTRRR